MKDKIFGDLEYEFGWIGATTIDWYGEEVTVNVIISGEEDEEPSSTILMPNSWMRGVR